MTYEVDMYLMVNDNETRTKSFTLRYRAYSDYVESGLFTIKDEIGNERKLSEQQFYELIRDGLKD